MTVWKKSGPVLKILQQGTSSAPLPSSSDKTSVTQSRKPLPGRPVSASTDEDRALTRDLKCGIEPKRTERQAALFDTLKEGVYRYMQTFNEFTMLDFLVSCIQCIDIIQVRIFHAFNCVTVLHFLFEINKQICLCMFQK